MYMYQNFESITYHGSPNVFFFSVRVWDKDMKVFIGEN